MLHMVSLLGKLKGKVMFLYIDIDTIGVDFKVS